MNANGRAAAPRRTGVNERVFALPAPGKFAALVFPVLLGLLLPAVLVAALVLADERGGDWPRAATLTLLLPVIAGVFAWSVRHREVVLLEDGRLQVRRWPVPKRAPRAEFDLGQARIVDLAREPSLQPGLKIAGTRLPGFASGKFWLKDKRRAYVLMTESRRVLVLPRHDGQVWLLGVERADALLAALRAQG
jgi:hypothetical protein